MLRADVPPTWRDVDLPLKKADAERARARMEAELTGDSERLHTKMLPAAGAILTAVSALQANEGGQGRQISCFSYATAQRLQA